jgi:membrane protein
VTIRRSAGFATMLYLGPDVDERDWRLVRPGAFVAVVVWLAASSAVAFYAAHSNFYSKAWGSLSAVIVVLTWLWLAGLALLFGAELDSEVEARATSAQHPAAAADRRALGEEPAVSG